MSSANHSPPPCIDLSVRHHYKYDGDWFDSPCRRCGLKRRVSGSITRYYRDGFPVSPSDDTGLKIGEKLADALRHGPEKARNAVVNRLQTGDLPWTWVARVLDCSPDQARQRLSATTQEG